MSVPAPPETPTRPPPQLSPGGVVYEGAGGSPNEDSHRVNLKLAGS